MRCSRTGGPLLLLGGVLGAAVACGVPTSPFNVANARIHVEHLAGAIGSRPLGSDANARARRYLIEQLELYGFTVRVQDVVARSDRIGVSARVRNIIAFKGGRRPEAIGLVAHYDSVEGAPGAADDGVGVAVALEAARVLAARERTWSLLVLLTDGEEDGLLGATAAVTDEEVVGRLQTYLNLEATGPEGPVVLFENGPGSVWMLEAWARSAPRPNGASYFEEIYRRLPNDTDFSVFRRAGIPGLNMAAIGNAYVYHSPQDTADRVSDRVLAVLGVNTVSWVEALEAEDITRRTADPAVFFDIAGRKAGVWSASAWQLVDMGLLIVALLGWLRLTFVTARRAGLRGLILAWVWAALTLALVAGTTVGGLWLLRAIREVYHPWYAHPWRTLLLIVLLLLSTVWVLFRLAAHLPRAARTDRDAALIWVPALAAWIGLAVTAAWAAPQGAYLWTLPAGAAGLLVGTAAGWRAPMAVASGIVALIVAPLWIPDTVDLLTFAVPTLGILPTVTPIWLLPLLLLLTAVMVLPPVAAALVATDLARPRFATRVLLTATVFTFAWAYMSEAYTDDRPERRLARYMADESLERAYWELAGNEPGLGVDTGAPAGWRRAAVEHPLGDGHRTLPWPFVFVAEAPVAPSPVTAVRRSVGAADGRIGVEVDITPHQGDVWVSLLLPAGRTPLETSHPGQIRDGRWRARFGVVPREGVTFGLTLPADADEWLHELRVAARTSAPGAIAPGLGPAWLPEGHASWTAWATFLVPVPPGLEPDAQPPSLATPPPSSLR